MGSRLDKDALGVNGAMNVACARPLDRAKAISALVREEALASERLGRLTDQVAAAMLDAKSGNTQQAVNRLEGIIKTPDVPLVAKEEASQLLRLYKAM